MSKETEMNLYQKLAEVRKAAAVIQKNKSGYGYKYVSDDEILAKITGKMDKLGISLIPSVTPETISVCPYTYYKDKKDKDKQETVNEILVSADMAYTWVNNEHPEERIVVPWNLVGQQSDASQAYGSGLTYSMRYFLLKFFNVATPESDPDAWRSKQRAAEQEEAKMLAAATIDVLHKGVTTLLSDKPDLGAAVKKMASKYVKGGDYFKITDPDLAAKLLEEFNNTYNKE